MRKKGWIRIFEAFLAVLLIFSIVLTLTFKQKTEDNGGEQISRLQADIIKIIAEDEVLKSKIIAGDRTSVEEKIKPFIPNWMNYSVSICAPLEVCGLNLAIAAERDIYSSEMLVISNMTEIRERKLKLFFWRK